LVLVILRISACCRVEVGRRAIAFAETIERLRVTPNVRVNRPAKASAVSPD